VEHDGAVLAGSQRLQAVPGQVDEDGGSHDRLIRLARGVLGILCLAGVGPLCPDGGGSLREDYAEAFAKKGEH
jgi:hypothetical protein